jgi:flagellar biosynthesis/type III secretory pathway protein FliH
MIGQNDKNNLYCFPELYINNFSDIKSDIIDKKNKTKKKHKNVRTFDNYGKVFSDNNGDDKTNINVAALYDQGFVEGEKAGIEEAKRKAEPVIKNFEEALNTLEEIKKTIYQNAEKETIKLAIAIAKKIISCEISTNKEIVVNVVRRALQQIPDKEKIKIRVNPDDLDIVLGDKEKLENVLRKFKESIFLEDENISNGGCIIETNSGDFDARIEKQIEIIENVFENEFNKYIE